MIFVALGIIVVAVLLIAITFRGDIAEIITKSATESKTGFSAQVEEVQEYIGDCLSNSLTKSVFTIANEKVEDYNERLGQEVLLNMGQCLELKKFKDLTIKKLTEPEVKIQRNVDNTIITATLTLPIRVEKGEDAEQLEEFLAQENLKKKVCVLKEQLTNNCMAKQDLKVGIFIFKEGQEVTMGGECLEC
ncbi:MAG: hypothetical protein V1914_02870 [archaeon]